MNLLLYTESKNILARLNGATALSTEPSTVLPDPTYALPDALFEELGYFGALEEEEEADDDDLDELVRWFAEPALTF